MAALKICSTMSWMYVVVLLIGWRDVQSHVLIERWVNPPISSISLHLSTLYVILSYRCFCAGNRPLLSLRGELRQWKCWPPRSLRNGRGCQWCEQGHHCAVWRSCWGRSQQVHRWDVTVFTWNMGFFFLIFFFWSCQKQLKASLLARWSGGRGVVVGPILSESRSDVFCDNENGPNFLFKNNGNGAFVDMATQAGENEVVREHEA